MNETPDITVEDMVKQLGGTEDVPSTDPAAPVETPDPEVQEPDKPEGTEDKPSETPAAAPQGDGKAQEAFIHMRQQNKRLSDTMRGVAKLFDLDDSVATDEEKLLEAIQTKITEKQATEQNLPIEVVQRLQRAEQLEHKVLEQDTAFGFEAVKTKYGLTQDQLNKFAIELVEQGKNPYVTSVNLMREYRDMHYDEIVAAEVAKAITAERERAAHAQETSTTPNTKTGAGTNGDPSKVNSVQQLEAWLRSQS